MFFKRFSLKMKYRTRMQQNDTLFWYFKFWNIFVSLIKLIEFYQFYFNFQIFFIGFVTLI